MARDHHATTTGRSGLGFLIRIEGLAVALLALLPLTVAGHYLANVVTGAASAPFGMSTAVWLVGFTAFGLLLTLAAVSTVMPGWRRAGLGARLLLAGGSVGATIDYWQMVDAPSGLLLNLAGVGAIAAALQRIHWAPRSDVAPVIPRPTARLQEWLAGSMVCGGVLAFALPHPSTIDGQSEECAPLWLIVDTGCANADVVWWPAPLAAIVLGLTMLGVLHHESYGPASVPTLAPTRGRAVGGPGAPGPGTPPSRRPDEVAVTDHRIQRDRTRGRRRRRTGGRDQ